MRKIFLVTVCLSVICSSLFSQKKLSDSEKATFEQKMLSHSKQMKSLQCNFVQTKTSSLVAEKVVSKGVMYYQTPSLLRWEYTFPNVSTLILNGNNAVLLDKNGNRMGNEKTLKQLGGIIISMINGNGIVASKQFSTEYYDNGTEMLVVLTPKQKQMKNFHSTIELKIDTKTMLANEITMNEKSGDKTTILLVNKELNINISDVRFQI
jgi:outer membrane lipoprotein carrier protein